MRSTNPHLFYLLYFASLSDLFLPTLLSHVVLFLSKDATVSLMSFSSILSSRLSWQQSEVLLQAVSTVLYIVILLQLYSLDNHLLVLKIAVKMTTMLVDSCQLFSVFAVIISLKTSQVHWHQR